MSDYIMVTFIGGPLDLSRRAIDLRYGGTDYRVLAPLDDSSFAKDAGQRHPGMMAPVKTFVYHIRQIGAMPDVYVGLPVN